jgi:D-glycero-alpha-D-manno-heptose-7-phosphate kinase
VIRFGTSGAIRVEPVAISPERKAQLESRLLLFYSGTSRMATDIANDVIANFAGKGKLLRDMHALVDQALSILRGGGDLDDFGRLLHETWRMKKCQSTLVSNPVVDAIYQKAMDAGALGGKLLGAGSSGFMVFFVPAERQPAVKRALEGLLHVPFAFDTEGSILLHQSRS